MNTRISIQNSITNNIASTMTQAEKEEALKKAKERYQSSGSKSGSMMTKANMVKDYNEKNGKGNRVGGNKIWNILKFSAKTVNDAITEACQKLGVTSDKLDYECYRRGF